MASAPPATVPPTERGSSKKKFKIGTRKSKLALLQTDIVLDALKNAWPEYEFEIHSKETAGDQNTDIALREFTTKNLWTQELEDLMLAGNLDLIVHSLKDVPTLLPSTCALGAVMEREDPRDVLVMKQGLPPKTLSELPAGSVVGTSSVRRTAQLASKYPHLKVLDVRGNIGTRLAKLDAEDSPFTCLILAAAGLLRLGLGDRITQYLDSKNGDMLYAVGQGALGIEIRKGDQTVIEMLNKIGHRQTTLACLAERSLLKTLEGGCSAPLGVETEWVQGSDGAQKLRMRSIVVSIDGKHSTNVEMDSDVSSPKEAEVFGVNVARELANKGADLILEAIRQEQRAREDSAFGPPFDIEFKWPLTRAERVNELQVMYERYRHTLQKANVEAAIAWHQQFPPDEIVPNETVCFQNGQRVEESSVDYAKGITWEEEPPIEDYMDDQRGNSKSAQDPV